MRKIFTLAFAALAFFAANAQYVCLEKGTVLTYNRTLTDENGKTDTSELTSTVIEAEKAADGVVNVRIETVAPIPGTVMGKTTEYSEASFNPNDSTTAIIVAGEEDSKQSIVDMIKAQVEGAGQVITDDQLNEIKNHISVKGELILVLSPWMTPETKFKNQTLTLTMKSPEGSSIIKINLWEIKVLGRETITVPAGTFDCLKVSYLQRTSAGGNIMKMYCTEWYADGIGEVKSEMSDSKGGKPVGVSELKSITRL